VFRTTWLRHLPIGSPRLAHVRLPTPRALGTSVAGPAWGPRESIPGSVPITPLDACTSSSNRDQYMLNMILRSRASKLLRRLVTANSYVTWFGVTSKSGRLSSCARKPTNGGSPSTKPASLSRQAYLQIKSCQL
jgi:hypothetical protein